MGASIKLYEDILQNVTVLCKMLQIKSGNRLFAKGRPLAITIADILALALFKQREGIETKKAVWEIVDPPCSYKTLVVSINRFSLTALRILMLLYQLLPV